MTVSLVAPFLRILNLELTQNPLLSLDWEMF